MSVCYAPEYNQYRVIYTIKNYKPSIESKIVNRSIEYGVPSQLALDIAYSESKFHPDAVSPDGQNFGVFQLNEFVVKRFKIDNPLDEDVNINFSVELLMQYRTEFNNSDSKVKCAWTQGPDKCN